MNPVALVVAASSLVVALSCGMDALGFFAKARECRDDADSNSWPGREIHQTRATRYARAARTHLAYTILAIVPATAIIAAAMFR